MNYTIYLYAFGTPARLNAIADAFEDSTGIHEAMAMGVEREVGDHLLGLNSRSPNTDFYAAAARGIEVESTKEAGVVRIPKLGFALRYYGGTVEPGKGISSFTGQLTKALAIPTDDVPVVGPSDGRHRQRPGDAGLLAFIPARNGGASGRAVGYLVEGEEKVITRGPRKGSMRKVAKPGGKLLYVLASSADHDADPSVLPAEGDIFGAASDAAADYIDSFSDDETGGEA